MDREQIAPLVRDLRGVFESARADLLRFAETLLQLDDSSTE
jgi:hypothetical protein